jgi:RNA polymerase sigma-70 factor, ECF subfamily
MAETAVSSGVTCKNRKAFAVGALNTSARTRDCRSPLPATSTLAANEATLSDPALASAMLAGEAAASHLAWRRFSPMVRRILRRFVSPVLEEDDLVQEVFLSLFRSLPSLRDPAALNGFVIAIAVHTGRYHARRTRKRRRCELPALPDETDHEVEALDDVDMQHALIRAERLLRHVRQRDRAAFVLRFVEGMKAHEVAEALGISLATARRRCVRARARFNSLAERDLFLTAYV